MQPEHTSHVGGVGVNAHHILLVEDDVDQATVLKTQLEERGHRVTLAKDGGQAHSAFIMRKPDFVVLDLILPGENGFEICEHMKELDETIPVLVLSAIDMPDSRELALRIGADGYVTKPCDFEQLLGEIYAIAERNWQKTHHVLPRERDESVVRFHCSACNARIKVKAVHRGRAMTCPKCHVSVMVPRHD